MVRSVRRAAAIGNVPRLRELETYFPEFIFAIGFVLYLLILYPGFMTNDSVSQILQARSGIYTDWHPPLMAFVWSFIDRILPGPSGMLALQSALIWLGAYLTHRAYFPGRRGFVFASALALVLFAPPVFGIAGAIWKDNLMWGVFFVAIGLAGHIGRLRRGNAARPLVLAVLVVALLTIGAAVRTNGIIAAVAILALMIYRAYPVDWAYRMPASLVASVCLSGVILMASLAISGALAAQRQNVWVALAVFDIAGVIEHSEQQDFREELYAGIPPRIRANGSVDDLRAAYRPRYWRALFASRGGPLFIPENLGFSQLDAAERATLRSTWLRGVSGDPTAWLKHRWAVFRHVLGLSSDDLWSFAMLNTNAFSEDYRNSYGTNPAPTWLQRRLEWHLQRSSSFWFFRPWTYFVVLIGVVLGSVVFNKHPDRHILFIALSGIMHEAALFMLAPSTDYRYSHYMVFTCLLSILLTIRSTKENQKQRTGLALS